jgi:hypothetical protein
MDSKAAGTRFRLSSRKHLIRLAAETQFFVRSKRLTLPCLDSLSAMPLDPLRTAAGEEYFPAPQMPGAEKGIT